MMFSIRSFCAVCRWHQYVRRPAGTALPTVVRAAAGRLRAPSKLLCLLWLAVGLRFLLPGGIPVSIRQPGSAAPIQQAGAVVQALTVPAELLAQALPSAAGSAPLPGSMFNIWVALAAIWAAGVVVLLVRAAAGYCRLRRMVTLCLQNAGWLLHLRRGCHAVHTWRAAPPHLYAAKPAGSPTPCGTAA